MLEFSTYATGFSNLKISGKLLKRENGFKKNFQLKIVARDIT